MGTLRSASLSLMGLFANLLPFGSRPGMEVFEPVRIRSRKAPKPYVLQPKRVIPRRRGKRIDPALALARVVARRRAERREFRRQREERRVALRVRDRLATGTLMLADVVRLFDILGAPRDRPVIAFR